MAAVIFLIFFPLILLEVVKLFVWIGKIIPFVKCYTGGKSSSWIWKTAMLNDYLLAREIIKKEVIKKPPFISIWEIISVLQIVCLITLFLIIRKQP
jgi:hypothetical protein